MQFYKGPAAVSEELTHPSLQGPCLAVVHLFCVVGSYCVQRIADGHHGSCASIEDVAQARTAGCVADFPGSQDQFAFCCAARVAVGPVGKLGQNSRIGWVPVGGARNFGRNMHIFFLSSILSI